MLTVRVSCTYRKSNWNGAVTGENYQCFVDDLRVEKDTERADSVGGKHSPGKTHGDVRSIFIEKSQAHYWPKGVEKFFRNIEGITVQDSTLKALTQEDLKGFSQLKELFIKNNKLTTLHSGLFDFNPKLKFISFSTNYLRSIPADLIDPIEDLDELRFAYNVCVSRNGKGSNAIKEVLGDVLEKCQNSDTSDDVTQLKMKIEQLEKDIERLSSGK